MKKRIVFSISLWLVFCLAFAGCGQKGNNALADEQASAYQAVSSVQSDTQNANDDIYNGSAWRAIMLCGNDGVYKDIVSNDDAIVLFIENDIITVIGNEGYLTFTYARNPDGFAINEDIDMQIEATIEGDVMTLRMGNFTVILEKCSIQDAVSCARLLAGAQGIRIPFEDEAFSKTPLPNGAVR